MTDTNALLTRPSTGSPGTGRRIPRLSLPPGISGLTDIVTRKYPSTALQYLGILLLAAGWWAGWLQPALSRPLRVTELTIAFPGGRIPLLSWGLLLAVAIVLGIVGLLPWGRRQPVWSELAAVLALTSTIGFAVQSLVADVALQENLARDRIELANLQLLVGYKIPRPNMTTIGPIPLPDSAALVFSALRAGFYLALAGAILLSIAAVVRRRKAAERAVLGRRIVQAAGVVAIVVLASIVVESVVAGRDLRQAQSSAAGGDDASAVAGYESAFDLNPGMRANPDLLAGYGTSQLRLGPADGPAVQLASSRLQLQAGKDLEALEILAAAADEWPGETAVRKEFTAQAFSYLRKRGAPDAVRGLISSGDDSALLRIALAKYELATGDNPTAIVDARAADALAVDDDVRSVALTFLSVAQTRSGDAIAGRETLEAAVDADKEFVNVMARSMLTGLYTTLPL